MIRRLVLALALAVLALPAWAAEPQALKPGEVLRGRFVQDRFLKGFDKPVRSEGSFVLAPGKGLIWRGEQPFPVTTAITAAGIVQSLGGKETMRLSAAKLPFLTRLHHMMGGALAGDWQALAGEFAVARQGSTISLTPRSSDPAGQPIRSITARIGRFVDEVDMVKPDGDHDHLSFFDQSLGTQPLSPDELAILDAPGR